MADISAGLAAILIDCLHLPGRREEEIQSHATRFLANIKAGASTDSLRKQAARIQLALGKTENDAECLNAVMRARAFVARISN
jgi:hypothetical protein